MTNEIPYFKIKKNGRAYFELGKDRAQKVGMKSSYPLGFNITEAKKSALDLYSEWLVKRGRPAIIQRPKKYKAGTVGHWYAKLKQTKTWENKKPETRRKWEFYWKYIDTHLGDIRLDRVTPSDFEKFHIAIETQYGADARWRTVKIARALFNSAIKYQIISTSPCLVLLAHEVETLIETAYRLKYEPMALSLRLAWETLMSPVDIRMLALSELKNDQDGYYIATERSKTGKAVLAALPDDLGRDIENYIARFFMDIRRSGNVEADLGGASAGDRAEILANALDKNKLLDQTYTPPTVAKARKIAKQRELGRAILDQQSRKVARQVGNERPKSVK